MFVIDEADKFKIDDTGKSWQHIDGVFSLLPLNTKVVAFSATYTQE